MAARTTSVEALKAYLQGERQYPFRTQPFERAIDLDSGFALAWVRLAQVQGWINNYPASRISARRAVGLSAALPLRDSLFVGAIEAEYEGDYERAKALYQEILRRFPTDAESWTWLGHLEYHYGWSRGEPVTAFREPLQRALEIDSSNLEVVGVLQWGMIFDQDAEALDRLWALDHPDGKLSRWRRISLANLKGDTASLNHGLLNLADAGNSELLANVVQGLVAGGGVVRGLEAARFGMDPSRPRAWRAYATATVVQLEAALGRTSRALEALAHLRDLDPSWALILEARLALAPASMTSDTTLGRLSLELTDWDARHIPIYTDPFFVHHVRDDIYPHIRVYLLGRIAARRGDFVGAEQYAQTLDSMPSPETSHTIAHDFARGVRMTAALYDGNDAAVVRLFRNSRRQFQFFEAFISPFITQSDISYLYASALAEGDDLDDALRWFEVAGSPFTLQEVLYRAPAHLRMAQLNDRLNDRQKAIDHYTKFIDLWMDADPELQPLVDEARRRLAELESEPVANNESRSPMG